MAWSNLGAGIQAWDSREDSPAAYLPTTSTSSLLMTDDAPDYTMRTFMNSVGDLKTAYKETYEYYNRADTYTPDVVIINSSADSDWANRYAIADVIPYVVSPTWTTPTGSESAFVSPILIDIGVSGQLYNTKIWHKRQAATIRLCRLTDTVGNWARDSSSGAHTVDIHYKDPCVIQLPEVQIAGWPYPGGWLMILGRYLMTASDEAQTAAPSPNPDNSLASIVAWWCDSPDFVGEKLIGPILLVDGAYSWDNDVYLRLWIGTPGATVVQAGDGSYELLLFYSVDESALGYVGTSGSTDLNDKLTESEYRAALDAMAFEPGIASKRIGLEYLSNVLVYEEYYVDSDGDRVYPFSTEEDWQPDYLSLLGPLLGGIRIWLPDGRRVGHMHAVRPFSEDYPANIRYADPAALRTGTEDDLASVSLMVATNVTGVGVDITPATASDLGTGHGLWRCRALLDGTLLYNSAKGVRVVATFGKDFLVATPDPDASTQVSPDQIVEDGTDTSHNWTCYDLNGGTADYVVGTHIRLDPDVVKLEDGSVRLLSGATLVDVSVAAGDRYPDGDLNMLSGTASDCTATAADLLDGDPWSPLPAGRRPRDPFADLPGPFSA